MDYLGDYDGWQVFKNSEGFLEGYKSTGKKISIDAKTHAHSDSKRIVTLTKDMGAFIKFVNGFKDKKPKITVIKKGPELF